MSARTLRRDARARAGAGLSSRTRVAASDTALKATGKGAKPKYAELLQRAKDKGIVPVPGRLFDAARKCYVHNLLAALDDPSTARVAKDICVRAMKDAQGVVHNIDMRSEAVMNAAMTPEELGDAPTHVHTVQAKYTDTSRTFIKIQVAQQVRMEGDVHKLALEDKVSGKTLRIAMNVDASWCENQQLQYRDWLTEWVWDGIRVRRLELLAAATPAKVETLTDTTSALERRGRVTMQRVRTNSESLALLAAMVANDRDTAEFRDIEDAAYRSTRKLTRGTRTAKMAATHKRELAAHKHEIAVLRALLEKERAHRIGGRAITALPARVPASSAGRDVDSTSLVDLYTSDDDAVDVDMTDGTPGTDLSAADCDGAGLLLPPSIERAWTVDSWAT